MKAVVLDQMMYQQGSTKQLASQAARMDCTMLVPAEDGGRARYTRLH